MPYTPGKETQYESVRIDDWTYVSTTGEDENLKAAIDKVANGIHGALARNKTDTIVAQNALLSLLAIYAARQTHGDLVSLDEITDSYNKVISSKAFTCFKTLWNPENWDKEEAGDNEQPVVDSDDA